MNRTSPLIREEGAIDSDDLIEHLRFMECELIFDFLVAAGAIFHCAALALVLAFLFY
jgi:hypothetical protein